MPTAQSAKDIAWLAVDWGTTTLRVWAMSRHGAVLAHATSARGMGTLCPSDYELALLDLVAHWLPKRKVTPVIACGMVGARQGWVEAPYRTVPCTPVTICKLTRAPVNDARLQVDIVAGLSQARPVDVMRGEETQVAGFLARVPRFTGSLCLPGTHSKWIRVEKGCVTEFKTCMTGELFALLACQSVLRHNVATDGWREQIFLKAVSMAFNSPAKVAAELFSLRAAALLRNDYDPVASRSRLSGLLIGLELAATKRYRVEGDLVVVVADAPLDNYYRQALRSLGISLAEHATEELALEGLIRIHHMLREIL